jgi:hypothetical protein
VGSKTLLVFKVGDVTNSFGKAVAANGNPASLLSDNGAVSPGRGIEPTMQRDFIGGPRRGMETQLGGKVGP